MPEQDFFAPSGLDEACTLLAEKGKDAVAIAGGTDIMVRFNRHRRTRQEALVFLGKLGLDYIKEEGGLVVVGACASLADVAASPLVVEKLPLLAQAAAEMASPAIRTAATLGGNAVTNSRYADGVAALVALDATVVVATTAGDKSMTMDEFVAAPRRDKLANGGIVKEFRIAPLAADEKWAWDKLGMRQGESRALVSVSMRAKMAGKALASLRLVLGGVAANPFASAAAARIMNGQEPNDGLIGQVAEAILEEISPADDVRASAWYRSKAAQALVRRVLSQLVQGS